MKLQHNDRDQWQVTLQRTHLDTLMNAAKRVIEGKTGRIPWRARVQLRKILEGYKQECDRLYVASSDSFEQRKEHVSKSVSSQTG